MQEDGFPPLPITAIALLRGLRPTPATEQLAAHIREGFGADDPLPSVCSLSEEPA